jgi:hypothetical protein
MASRVCGRGYQKCPIIWGQSESRGIKSVGLILNHISPYKSVIFLDTFFSVVLMHYATSQKVRGSIPDEVIEFFN